MSTHVRSSISGKYRQNTSGKIDTATGKYLNDIDKIPNVSFTRKLDIACHFNLPLTLEPKNEKMFAFESITCFLISRYVLIHF